MTNYSTPDNFFIQVNPKRFTPIWIKCFMLIQSHKRRLLLSNSRIVFWAAKLHTACCESQIGSKENSKGYDVIIKARSVGNVCFNTYFLIAAVYAFCCENLVLSEQGDVIFQAHIGI